MQPILHRFAPTVVESGFENFKMTFKWSEYRGCCQPYNCISTSSTSSSNTPAAAASSTGGSPVPARLLPNPSNPWQDTPVARRCPC